MRSPYGSGSKVIVILGSPADMDWGRKICDELQRFGVQHDTWIASAHKTPEYLLRLLREQECEGGPRTYITVAGRSNALSGFVDAHVTAPVLACPPASDAFGGMDILSSLRMPRGVAPMVVLEPSNAALAAAKILALADVELGERVAGAQDAERQRVLEAQT